MAHAELGFPMFNDYKPAASQTVAFQFFACADALPDFDLEVLVMLQDGTVSLARRIKPTHPSAVLWYSPARCVSPANVSHWAELRPLKAEPAKPYPFDDLADLADSLDLTESRDLEEIRTDALVEIAAWMPTLAAALCAKTDPAELASWADTFSAAQRS